jgi:hypothetical protein
VILCLKEIHNGGLFDIYFQLLLYDNARATICPLSCGHLLSFCLKNFHVGRYFKFIEMAGYMTMYWLLKILHILIVLRCKKNIFTTF